MAESMGPGWRPDELRRTIDDGLTALVSTGTPPTWTLSADDTRRARAMLLLLLALPGSVFLDRGEGHGPAAVEDLPDLARRDSMLAFGQSALNTRRTLDSAMAPGVTWLGGPDGVLAFARGNFACTLNLSDRFVPAIGPVLLSSAPVSEGLVPPETAVWTSGLPGADQAAQHTVHEGG